MSYCSNCGQKIETTAKFCNNCGSIVKKENNINVKIIKCPNCDADVEYRNDKDNMKCHFCGADIVIDDEATELNRVLNAKMNAQKREMDMNMEYEKHQHVLNTQKSIIDFFIGNPIFGITLVLVIIHSLISIVNGELAPLHIIIYAIILGIVYKKTKS